MLLLLCHYLWKTTEIIKETAIDANKYYTFSSIEVTLNTAFIKEGQREDCIHAQFLLGKRLHKGLLSNQMQDNKNEYSSSRQAASFSSLAHYSKI